MYKSSMISKRHTIPVFLLVQNYYQYSLSMGSQSSKQDLYQLPKEKRFCYFLLLHIVVMISIDVIAFT